MSEVIIDIETLGTRQNSIILTIGAIKFNRYDKLKPLKEYESLYMRIRRDSCEDIGLQTDSDTIEWWSRQSEDVRNEAFEDSPDRIPIKEALLKLSNFIRDCEYFWSQGSLDEKVLEFAYITCEMSIPWRYWKYFDSRTLFHVMQINIRNIDHGLELRHNSLVDCYRQLIGMYYAFND